MKFTAQLAAIFAFSVSVDGQEPEKETPPPPIPKYPEPETVLASMKRATAYFRTHLSFAGGYASSWARDDVADARTENGSAPTIISIQPPGTTTVGRAMLGAFLETGDPLFKQGAVEAGQALMWCQLASGGWGHDFQFDPKSARRLHFRRDIDAGDIDPGKRRRRSSLDDDKTQSAIRYLLELAHSPAGDSDPALRHALDFALDGLLAAQAPNGGWPQQYSDPADPTLPVKKASFPAEWPRTFPAVDYTGFYTLNDNNLFHVMNLLLRAHRLEKENNARFLESAKHLGDFLLAAQFPEPQPVWAQQYNREMQPAWARKFEPPALCSVESVGAMRSLIELWLATGESKYIATLPAAIKWFERSRLKSGEWARFYEMRTNKPLYCKTETYEITYEDSDLPTHYGFKVQIGEALDKVKTMLSESRGQHLARRENDRTEPEKKWSERARKLASKARSALKEQKKEGYWVKDDAIDSGLFVKHMEAMTAYLEAAKNGGETFIALREKERSREASEKKSKL